MKGESLAAAERAVKSATQLTPQHAVLVALLLQSERRREAEQLVVAASELESGSAEASDELAYVARWLGQHEISNRLYRQAAAQAPSNARYWYNLATSERSAGRLTEAEECCDRAISADPRHYQSYLLRSELRLQTQERHHVREMQALLSHPDAEPRAKLFLGYALAKELDDLQEYDEAFRWLTIAAGVRRAQLAYDVAVDEQKLARIAAVFGPSQPAAAADPSDSERFIFIMGLPRSGTTLLERILTGIEGVTSNGETENFSHALLTSAPAQGGDVFSRAASTNPADVAHRYRKLAIPPDQSVRVIDKLPMNYLYVGAIRRALPRAAIVCVRRSPIDSCFAMYRTLFGTAYPFSYDFEDLARYYAAYDTLIAHWRGTLGCVYEIAYEDLVARPAAVCAGVAEHCGLAWNPGAINVQANRSVSLTASAAQVRRSIYDTSVGKWLRYKTRLRPLVEALDRRGVLDVQPP